MNTNNLVSNNTHNVKFKKLRIKNFLAYKEIEFDFEENGAYHIWGENNTGKSAMLYAIRTLIRNVSNIHYKSFLRDDCASFLIEAEMWDGNRITLSRGATDYYEWFIDGNRGFLDKTKGKVPDAVEEYFNFYIDNEKTKECLNLRMARDTLLFVDSTAGDSAYLLQKALGTEDILLAMKLGEAKRKELKKEAKVFEGIIETEDEKMKKVNEKLTEKVNKVDELKTIYNVINTEYDEINEFVELFEIAKNLIDAENQQKELEEQLNILNFDELDTLAKELKQLNVARNYAIKSLKYKKEEKEILAKSISDAELETIKKMADDLKELEKMQELQSNFDKSNEELQALEETYNAQSKLLADMEEIIPTINSLESCITEMENTEKYEEEHNRLNEIYIQSDADLMEYMKENSFCPLVAQSHSKKCPFHKEVTI